MRRTVPPSAEIPGGAPRPAQGRRAGRLGFSEGGERALLAVMLGMRESYADWLALATHLIARGLGAPTLIVADGAPGPIEAIEQCWPASDRQRCCVHRARNLYAELPERERERVKQAYWRRSTTRSARATPSSDSRRWSTSSTRAATPPGAKRRADDAVPRARALGTIQTRG